MTVPPRGQLAQPGLNPGAQPLNQPLQIGEPGRPDLKDTIARLQAYQAAGADVLYAPGLTRLDDIRAVVTSVDRPVNVLTMAGTPEVAELAAAGVRRVSVGGAFAFAAYGALADAARELRDRGSYGFLAGARGGRDAVRAAFS